MGAVRRATRLRALRVLPLPHRCRRQVDVGYGEGLEERVYNALPVVFGLEHVGGDEDVDLLRVDVEQVGERVVPVALHRVPIRNDTVRQWSAVVAHPLQARRRQHRLRCLRAGEPDLDAPAPVVDDHAGRLTAEWSGRGRQHRGEKTKALPLVGELPPFFQCASRPSGSAYKSMSRDASPPAKPAYGGVNHGSRS